MGAPEWGEDPRFAKNVDRAANLPAWQEFLHARFKTDTQAAWLRKLAEADVPVAPVRSVTETMNSEEVSQRDMVLALERENGEQVKVLGSPLKLSESVVAKNATPPPRLAEHTREVLSELGILDETRLNELIKIGAISIE